MRKLFHLPISGKVLKDYYLQLIKNPSSGELTEFGGSSSFRRIFIIAQRIFIRTTTKRFSPWALLIDYNVDIQFLSLILHSTGSMTDTMQQLLSPYEKHENPIIDTNLNNTETIIKTNENSLRRSFGQQYMYIAMIMKWDILLYWSNQPWCLSIQHWMSVDVPY